MVDTMWCQNQVVNSEGEHVNTFQVSCLSLTIFSPSLLFPLITHSSSHPQAFSPDDGTLTASLKLVPNRIAVVFAAELEQLKKKGTR